MSQPVHEYVAQRVGQIWTAEDAAFVADKIRQIEQVAEQVVRLNQNGQKSSALPPPANREGAGSPTPRAASGNAPWRP